MQVAVLVGGLLGPELSVSAVQALASAPNLRH